MIHPDKARQILAETNRFLPDSEMSELPPLMVSEMVLTAERMVELGLTQEQQEFLSQYEPISFSVWSEAPIQGDFRLSQFTTIGLAEGLISNHDEWDNPHQSLVKAMQRQCNKSRIFRAVNKPLAFFCGELSWLWRYSTQKSRTGNS